MKFSFLPPAIEELRAAVQYYNNESEGLGFEFALEAKRTLARIREYPDAWPRLSSNTQRCRMNRFPYGIVYHNDDNKIILIAIMHLRRHPESWRQNLKDA